jgi:YHS domain-containing protein
MVIFTLKVTDPVCGMKLDPEKMGLMVCEQGVAYYFCGNSCLESFKADPLKFIQAGQNAGNSLWRRYLHRLKKVTGGKPMRCH